MSNEIGIVAPNFENNEFLQGLFDDLSEYKGLLDQKITENSISSISDHVTEFNKNMKYAKAIQSVGGMISGKTMVDGTDLGIGKVFSKGMSVVSTTEFIGRLMNEIIYGNTDDETKSIMSVTKLGAGILVDGIDLAKFFLDTKLDAVKSGVSFSNKLLDNCFSLKTADPLWARNYDLNTRSIAKNFGLTSAKNAEVATDTVELLSYKKLGVNDIVDTGFVDQFDDLAKFTDGSKINLKSVIKLKLNKIQMKIGKMLGVADDYDALTDFAKYDYLLGKGKTPATSNVGKLGKLSKFSKALGTGLNAVGVGVSALGLGISAKDLDDAIENGDVQASHITGVVSTSLNLIGAVAAFAGPPGMIASAVLTTIAGVTDMVGAICDLPENPSPKEVMKALGKGLGFFKTVGSALQAEDYRKAMEEADNDVDKGVLKTFYQIECLNATPGVNLFSFIYEEEMKEDAREELESRYGTNIDDILRGVFVDRMKDKVDNYVDQLTETFGDKTIKFVTMSALGSAAALYDDVDMLYSTLEYTRDGESRNGTYKADYIAPSSYDYGNFSAADAHFTLENASVAVFSFQKSVLEKISEKFYSEFTEGREKTLSGSKKGEDVGVTSTAKLGHYYIYDTNGLDNLVIYSLNSTIKPIIDLYKGNDTVIFNKPIIADVKHHKSIQAEVDGNEGNDLINLGDISNKENQTFRMEYTADGYDYGASNAEKLKASGTLKVSADYIAADEILNESQIVARSFESIVLPSISNTRNILTYNQEGAVDYNSDCMDVKTLSISSGQGTKYNRIDFRGAESVAIKFLGIAERNMVDGTNNNDFIAADDLTNDDSDETNQKNVSNVFNGWSGDDILVGTSGAIDILNGGEDNDLLDGKGGKDELRGEQGNDILSVYEDTSIVDGGDGIDKIDFNLASKEVYVDFNEQIYKFANEEEAYRQDQGAWKEDKQMISMEQAVGSKYDDYFKGFIDRSNYILAHEGNDWIDGGSESDVLNGGKGSDIIYGYDGDDSIAGEEGNDALIAGKGNDNIYGGLGSDYIVAEEGDDTIFSELLVEKEDAKIHDGDKIWAGAGDDVIYASSSDDTIDAGEGNDSIYGRRGNDTINAGAGDDIVDDIKGSNTINGDGGNDTIYDYHGNEFVSGGEGYDYIDYSNMKELPAESTEEQIYRVKIDMENELFEYRQHSHEIVGFEAVVASEFDDEITGTAIDNNIEGNYGNDIVYARAGNDIVKGGDGDDQIYGETGDDKLYGGLGSDEIDGGSGDDTIYGEQGDDVLVGGAGDDFMAGGIGNDELIGGAGDDKMFGGLGDDTYRFSGHNFGDDSIYDPAAGNDKIVFEGLGSDDLTFDRNGKDLVINSVREDGGRLTVSDWFAGADHKMDIESSDGYDFTEKIRDKGLANDVIRGDEKANVLYGKFGDDELHGLGGADKLYGGIGNDNLYGGDGNDELYGGDGNDNLYAGNGDVRLEGGAGNDLYHIDKDSSGHKTIYTENGANENIIMEDAAFFTSDIELEKQDDDLTITFKDKNNSAITIEDWFAGDEHKVGINKGRGGTYNQFTVSQIEKLIDDMAIFGGDSGVGVVDPQGGNTENPVGDPLMPIEWNPFTSVRVS